MKITDKDSFVNVAELKRKLRAWAKYRQMSIQTTNDLLGIIAKLPITIRGQLEEQLQAELDNSHCLEIELIEAKRLLKAAVEDFAFVSENFINNMDSSCSMYNHIAGCKEDCPMNSSDEYGRCKWRHMDEALKLIGDEPNGI